MLQWISGHTSPLLRDILLVEGSWAKFPRSRQLLGSPSLQGEASSSQDARRPAYLMDRLADLGRPPVGHSGTEPTAALQNVVFKFFRSFHSTKLNDGQH